MKFLGKPAGGQRVDRIGVFSLNRSVTMVTKP